MSIDLHLLVDSATLVVLLGFLIRNENRLTKMETLVSLLVEKTGITIPEFLKKPRP